MENDSAIYIADSLLDQKDAFLHGRATRIWQVCRQQTSHMKC